MTNLKLVLLELGGLRLLEGNSHSGDGVVVGAALERGEDGAVNPLGEVMRDNNFVTRDFKIIIEAMTLQDRIITIGRITNVSKCVPARGPPFRACCGGRG